jgi:hypothetical protein
MPRAIDRSESSVVTGAHPQIALSVEHEIASTYTVVRLTCSPVVLRWIKRLLVAQVALDTAALVGSSTWTFVRDRL